MAGDAMTPPERPRMHSQVWVNPPTLARAILARWYLVLVTAVVISLLTYLWDATRTEVYTAHADVQLTYGAAAVVVGPNVFPAIDPKRNLANAESIISNNTVRANAQNSLRRSLPAAIATSGDSDDIVTVSVTDRNASLASSAANAYVDAFLDVETANLKSQLGPARSATVSTISSIDAQVIALNARLQALVKQLTADSTPADVGLTATVTAAVSAIQGQVDALGVQRTNAAANLSRIDGALALGSVGAIRLTRATTPSAPSAPRRKRDSVVGFLGGAILGSLAAALIPAARRVKREPLHSDAAEDISSVQP